MGILGPVGGKKGPHGANCQRERRGSNAEHRKGCGDFRLGHSPYV